MASDNPDEWWRHAPEGQQKDSPSGQWPSPGASQGGGPPQAGGPMPPGAPWGQLPPPGPQQQGAWEIPPLGSGSGGPPSKNNGPLIAVLAVVVVLVLAGVAGLVVLQSGESGEATPNTAGGSSTAAGGSEAPSSSASPNTTTTSLAPGPGEPEFREGTTPVAVVGPTWEDGADTYTMAFKDWPFAFRTPGSWGCMKGSVEGLPEAQAWRCIDEGDSGAGQKVDLILRECPNGCDDATRTQFDEDFFQEPGSPEVVDDNTSYIETAAGDTGEYVIEMSRFFAAEPGGEVGWHVGVLGSSPAATKDAVLKTVNDVATQTQ